MSENITPAPPGTVPLMQYEGSLDSVEFLLSPTPSSDPNEPLNWSKWRKYLNFGLVTAVTVAAFTNLTVQTVFWQQMTRDLNVSISQLANGQSAQLAGLAVGCIFFIPFTIKYGRRTTYLASTAVLAGASWWTARMNSYAEIILTSFISGLAGAINETVVQMTISDLFFVHQRGSANGIYFVAVMVGSFLVPMAAGSQASIQGWRWSYYALAISLTALLLVFVVLFEETKYVPVTVGTGQGVPEEVKQGSDEERTKADSDDVKQESSADLAAIKSNLAGHDDIPLNSHRQRLRLVTKTSESLLHTFLLPIRVIFLPHVLFTAIQFASGVCWLLLFLTGTSVIFSSPPYLFTTAGIGYMGLGPFVGNILGSIYGGPFADWLVVRLARRNGGIFEPEMRLYPLALTVFTMAGGLIMFGVTAARGMHWIYPSVGGAFFAFGLGANGDITFTLVIDTYRELTAEAFVGVAFIRNAAAVGMPSALIPWMTSMGVSNMYITIGCISFAIGLFFVPMIIWGKRMRVALAPRYQRLVEHRMKH